MLLYVSDRVPKQTLCSWCCDPLPKAGYVRDVGFRNFAYCSPLCAATHQRVSEAFITSYHKHKELVHAPATA